MGCRHVNITSTTVYSLVSHTQAYHISLGDDERGVQDDRGD